MLLSGNIEYRIKKNEGKTASKKILKINLKLIKKSVDFPERKAILS